MMVASHALHGVAWLTTRWLPVHVAMRVTREAGSLLRPLGKDEATSVAKRLRGGTCLTRSMAVAARVPRSNVVIGGSKEKGAFGAHAWVELEGRPLSGQTASKVVMVRLS
jgi:hypothetical protein